jgi:hypothetical protein
MNSGARGFGKNQKKKKKKKKKHTHVLNQLLRALNALFPRPRQRSGAVQLLVRPSEEVGVADPLMEDNTPSVIRQVSSRR